MRIGIDIDGVLTDIEKWQLDYASKFYYEKYNKEIVNYKGYETIEIFNSDEKYDNEFWMKYFKEMDLKIPSWYNSKEDLCMQDFLNFLLKQL